MRGFRHSTLHGDMLMEIRVALDDKRHHDTFSVAKLGEWEMVELKEVMSDDTNLSYRTRLVVNSFHRLFSNAQKKLEERRVGPEREYVNGLNDVDPELERAITRAWRGDYSHE